MVLKLYNTLTRKQQEFKPIKKGKVLIYSCGPTVYNFAHIGNFRAYIVADLLRRYLKYKGFKLKHVMNITDVDDKTIRDSRKAKLSIKKFTEKYTKAFFDDIKTLNIEKVENYPKATESIKDMVKIVKKLLDKNLAYKGDDGSIYFSISKFRNYGKLSHAKLDKLKVGARVKQDEYEKESANDFALWKAWDKDDGDVFWDTELGKGRPGWHIECSAMAMANLGTTFDIHTGGVDLIFPHHENEIAQSEGSTGKKFVNYWIHNEHLLVNNRKMSKSLGNFYTLRDILKKGYDARSIRFVLLSAHYRKKLNFTFEGLDAAKNTIERLDEFVNRLRQIKDGKENKGIKDMISQAKNEFESALDDDLEISTALAAIFEFLKAVNILISENKIGKSNAKDILTQMLEFDKVLGLLKTDKEDLPKDIKKLMDEREKARKKKEWKTADNIRDEIKSNGYEIKDTPHGVVWKKIT